MITPGDLITACPSLWPFANRQLYTSHARLLPLPIYYKELSDRPIPGQHLRVAAILVFHDPRDWALDIQIVVDLLLSAQGYLGTLSAKNGRQELSNRGYQQDGQPKLWVSNPDIFWAAEYQLDRLGQGAFTQALTGVWAGITGGRSKGTSLKHTRMGKPSYETYVFAERKLINHRKALFNIGEDAEADLEDVYMIGGTCSSKSSSLWSRCSWISDNPASDIKGANDYNKRSHTSWHSILVETGVHKVGEIEHYPNAIVPDVERAVKWALKKSKWPEPLP